MSAETRPPTGRGVPPGSPQGWGPSPRSQQPAGLPNDYLGRGYFDSRGDLWPELVVEDAKRVAQILGQRERQVELKTAQLRRFYNKARSIEQKLSSAQSFDSLRSELLSLQPLAAVAVARGSAPEVFKQFIEKNVSLAVRDEKHFRSGFLFHFQSVVAYFAYQYRR